MTEISAGLTPEQVLIDAGLLTPGHGMSPEEVAALAAEFQSDQQETAASVTPRLKDFMIEVMHGQALFKMPNSDQPVESFTAVIMDVGAHAAWYEAGYTEGSSDPPDCASTNMRNGSRAAETRYAPNGTQIAVFGECARCHYNQWGSSRTGSNAKDCTNYKLLLLKVQSQQMPMILRASPTSIRAVEDYLKSLLKQKRTKSSVFTTFSLKRVTDKYCELDLAFKAPLKVDQWKAIGEMKQQHQHLLPAMAQASTEPAQIEHQEQGRAEAQPQAQNTAPASDPAPPRTPPSHAGEPTDAVRAEEGF